MKVPCLLSICMIDVVKGRYLYCTWEQFVMISGCSCFCVPLPQIHPFKKTVT